MADRSMEDEDFDYGDSLTDDMEDHAGDLMHMASKQEKDNDLEGGGPKTVFNQPYDEEMDLEEDSETDPAADKAEAAPGASRAPSSSGKGEVDIIQPTTALQGSAALGATNSGDATERQGSLPAEAGQGSSVEEYNAHNYKDLPVSDEIKELFEYIGRYKPSSVEIDTKLKPFIPDYIPAVGDIDEFIKVPRPDGKQDGLGLSVLDEPAAQQSDPTILNLQLRQLSKQADVPEEHTMGKVLHSDENKQGKVENWVKSIVELHKRKPPPVVTCSKRMPDIETLMQEWPPQLEQLLSQLSMPGPELDLDLRSYAQLLCNLADIPVYDNIIESLHVLFTLVLELQSNPYIQQQQEQRAHDPLSMTADSGGMMQGIF